MHVTEKPGITTLASGIVGSRENAVTRTPSRLGHWYHSNNLSPHSPSVAGGSYHGYIRAGPFWECVGGEGADSNSSHSHPTDVQVFPHWPNSSAVPCVSQSPQPGVMVMQVSLGPSHLCYCPVTQSICHHSHFLSREKERVGTSSLDLTSMTSIHFAQVFNQNAE